MKRRFPLWTAVAALVVFALPAAVSAQSCGKCDEDTASGPHSFGSAGAHFECDAPGCHGASREGDCPGEHGDECGISDDELEQLATVMEESDTETAILMIARRPDADVNLRSRSVEFFCGETLVARLRIANEFAESWRAGQPVEAG